MLFVVILSSNTLNFTISIILLKLMLSNILNTITPFIKPNSKLLILSNVSDMIERSIMKTKFEIKRLVIVSYPCYTVLYRSKHVSVLKINNIYFYYYYVIC